MRPAHTRTIFLWKLYVVVGTLTLSSVAVAGREETNRLLDDVPSWATASDKTDHEGSMQICSVVNGLEVVRLISGKTRDFFRGAIEDVEFLREYMTEAMLNGGIVGGLHTSLEDLAVTLDWQARNLPEGTTTVDANIGYSDDREDRRVDRYVGLIHEPLVGSKEADLAMCDVLSNMLPWITDRQSKEDSWWKDHQNGRSEGFTKEALKVDRLYTGVWIVSYGEVLLYYPPLAVYGHPFTIGDVFGNNYDSRSEGVIPPYFPWNDATKQAKFSSPYPDIAVPGLSLITAGAPVHYTGEWFGYTYNDTYVGTIGIDITIDSVSALLDDLYGTLTRGSFAILVDSDFSVVVISQPIVEKIFPKQTGMEEGRITYDKTTGEVVQDRRNQTYLVSDTIIQPLTDLTNANWKGLQRTIFSEEPGTRGFSEMNVNLTGESEETLFYVMYERWPNVADWAVLTFAPVFEVENSINAFFVEDTIRITSKEEDTTTPTGQATFVNNGFLDVTVALKSIPNWIQITSVTQEGIEEEITVKAGSTLFFDFTLRPDELKQGTTTSLIVLTVKDASYAECFFSQTSSVEILVEIEQLEESESLGPMQYVGIAFTGLALILILAIIYATRKRSLHDNIWKVKRSELEFDSPPEIVGRGTFGLVLKAQYRGTSVACKRVLPPNNRNKITKNSSIEMENAFNDETMMDSSFPNCSTDQQEQAQSNRGVASGQFARRSAAARASQSGGNFGTMSGFNKSVNSGDSGDGIMSYFFKNRDRAALQKLKKDFVQEMKVLSKLRHPNVTTTMGAVIDKVGDPMLIMEMMDHGSLFDLLHNETMVLEAEILLPILRDIVQGGLFLHSANPQIIHGDLKAANILVDDRFRAKVADFGLSQKRQLGATGTPYWMAPELLRKESTNTAASDVYAFGVVLYEVFSRKEPYEGEDPREVLRLVADPKVNKRPRTPEHCPEQIVQMMNDCLMESPNQRPTFQELSQRLQRVNTKAIEEKQAPPPPSTLFGRTGGTVSLFDIFPKHVAEALRDGRKVEAEHRDMVTCFFSDVVGFTDISSQLPPSKVANLLDRLYHEFDEISQECDVFKVETIGDAYMAVTNLVKDQSDHATRIATFAMKCIEAANATLVDVDDPSRGYVNIRAGFHSGPVVADVVGSRNPRYCLFGDTVNTASRMESNSKANRINCSERAAELLREQNCSIPLIPRGMVSVKGKGELKCYWLGGNNTRISSTGSGMDDDQQSSFDNLTELTLEAATDLDDELSTLHEVSDLDLLEQGQHCSQTQLSI